jgi:hypothetical protein
MNIHATILSRTVTAEFYRANAMFFLVVMGLCFGFMSGVEHMALAGFFVSSVWLVLIPIGVWIIYTLKIMAYNRSETRVERNWFLYSLPLLNLPQRIFPSVVVATGQLAPAMAYGLFVAMMAFKQHQYIELSMIVSALLTLLVITTWHLDRLLVFPAKEESTSLPVRWLDKQFSKAMTWMFTEGVVRLQPGLMYITKLATCLVIFGATQLYEYDVYDERLYMMTACVAFSANLALVFQYQRFEVVQLLLIRSLPIAFTKRVGSFIVAMMILCFPETAMLITNLPAYLAVKFYFYSLFFGIALMLMGYGALYVRDATFDNFTRWIFFVTMGLLLLILFAVPVWLMGIVLGASGIFLLKRNYYSFEVRT